MYFFSDVVKNYISQRYFQNDAEDVRDLLIQEIDVKYDAYNERIDALEKKDKAISELESKVAEMNSQIEKLALENQIRSDQNAKLIELIKPLTASLISGDTNIIEKVDIIEAIEDKNTTEGSLSIISVNQDKVNMAQLSIGRSMGQSNYI